MLLMRLLIIILWFGLSAISSADNNSVSEKILFEKLALGKVMVIMRHAIAPGGGDPENFVLGQCNTQRNLSAEGKEQAKKIGDRFRQYGIFKANIYSSQWCRCIDTATELRLGNINELPILNSFFESYEKKTPQTQTLVRWLQSVDSNTPLVLVTHQVNITALTGIVPRSGEMLFIGLQSSGKVTVEGSIL